MFQARTRVQYMFRQQHSAVLTTTFFLLMRGCAHVPRHCVVLRMGNGVMGARNIKSRPAAAATNGPVNHRSSIAPTCVHSHAFGFWYTRISSDCVQRAATSAIIRRYRRCDEIVRRSLWHQRRSTACMYAHVAIMRQYYSLRARMLHVCTTTASRRNACRWPGELDNSNSIRLKRNI